MSAPDHLTWDIDPETRSATSVFKKRIYQRGNARDGRRLTCIQFVNRRYTAEHGGCAYETVFAHFDGDKIAAFIRKHQYTDGRYSTNKQPTKFLNLRPGSMVPGEDGKYQEVPIDNKMSDNQHSPLHTPDQFGTIRSTGKDRSCSFFR